MLFVDLFSILTFNMAQTSACRDHYLSLLGDLEYTVLFLLHKVKGCLYNYIHLGLQVGHKEGAAVYHMISHNIGTFY